MAEVSVSGLPHAAGHIAQGLQLQSSLLAWAQSQLALEQELKN